MKKIAVVTASRAEYGLLTPLISAIYRDKDVKLDLIVTGTHLSKKYGYTINDIFEDGFPIAHMFPILEEGNTPYDVSVTMANAIKESAQCFHNERPDMVVILGDRTEMLGIASAAMNERIPIAHIHGGEVTEGAVDDCVRHALTKMSYLHFTASEEYRKRVIQLGESPDRVFNVGSLGTENILNITLLSEDKVRENIGIEVGRPYVIVTFHPVTLDDTSAIGHVFELCKAMEKENEYFYLITKSNADTGGDAINRMLNEYAEKHKNVKLVDSLGVVRYLSAVKYASFVLGNSSSGILEAPVLGTPTINIGDRQKGRVMAETIINCTADYRAILEAINKVQKCTRKATYIFGNGSTSKEIIRIIKDWLLNDRIDLKKGFYTIETAC